MSREFQVEYQTMYGKRAKEKTIFKVSKSLFDHILSHAKEQYELRYLYPFPTQTIQIFLEKRFAQNTIAPSFLMVTVEKKVKEIDDEGYIKIFVEEFPEFILRSVNVLEEESKTRYTFEFLPVSINEESPIVRTGFLAFTPQLTPQACVFRLQQKLERAYQKRIVDEGRVNAFEKFSIQQANVSFGQLPEKMETAVSEQKSEEMLQLLELRTENHLLLIENKKYHNLFSVDEKNSDKGKWKVLSAQEYDDLSERVRFVSKLWEIHTQLLRLLSSNTERKATNAKREKMLTIQHSLSQLRMEKIIEEGERLAARKLFKKFLFVRTGKVKILQEDYARLLEISSFSHFLEEENTRIKELANAPSGVIEEI
ncbi:hypothetical protein SAMN02745116_00784 [Pilibacter termitis]|uniref:Uncharacterized protein n=1 Tax=Pilibacter termitis TaxID=263852 RepID=A0A1T4LRS1_9ENTE|nr:hypothetical protein [Pilibacter termitis]SJZ57420.1 hypothetical protein SAMN02745116_00784 [Pilibacter termitis]